MRNHRGRGEGQKPFPLEEAFRLLANNHSSFPVLSVFGSATIEHFHVLLFNGEMNLSSLSLFRFEMDMGILLGTASLFFDAEMTRKETDFDTF